MYVLIANFSYFLKLQTDEILRLNGIYKRLLSNAGVKLYEGEGKIVGPNEVEVTQLDGTKLSYSAKHILIATGSRAQRAPIPGQVIFWFSDIAWLKINSSQYSCWLLFHVLQVGLKWEVIIISVYVSFCDVIKDLLPLSRINKSYKLWNFLIYRNQFSLFYEIAFLHHQKSGLTFVLLKYFWRKHLYTSCWRKLDELCVYTESLISILSNLVLVILDDSCEEFLASYATLVL